MRCWSGIRGGCDPKEFPEKQKSEDDYCTFIVINNKGILTYETTPTPIEYEENIYASGSGRDYAMAALHYGKTAVEAVELACLYNNNCGDGIDTLTL